MAEVDLSVSHTIFFVGFDNRSPFYAFAAVDSSKNILASRGEGAAVAV
jgi:hypothetical protein